jgi:predicted amidohydrolase
MWELMGEAVSRFSNAFVIYCNRAGFEDGKAFAGGSFIFNPLGRLIVKAPSLEEKLLFADLDLREIREASQAMPFKRDDRPEIILHALRRIIKSYED